MMVRRIAMWIMVWAFAAAVMAAPPESRPAKSAALGPPADSSITIFKDVPLESDPDVSEGATRHGMILRHQGQVVETTVDLPPPPKDQRDARRIVATLIIKPVMSGPADKPRPGDRYTRVASVRIVKPGSNTATVVASNADSKSTPAPEPTDTISP